MILYEEAHFDEIVTRARFAVLEAMEPAMKIHAFSSIQALDQTLHSVVEEMKSLRRAGWDIPEGLTRIALVFTDPRAISVVGKYMAPGFDYAVWPQPDAWLSLYQRIDDLRDRARQFDPQFVPRHL